MRVTLFDHQNDLIIQPEKVAPIVKWVLKEHHCQTDEVVVYFVTQQEICSLHEEFFDDPSVTDCMTFPMDGLDEYAQKIGDHLLGEIFVCPKTAIESVNAGISDLKDAYQETTLYLVHGLLHLLGYTDVEQTEREKMQAHQNELLQTLISKNLILS